MKKFSLLIICFMMVLSCCLTGCSKFSVNQVKYYNEVVATVGDDQITRFDLINDYNSYGYSYYVSQQGLSEKEALNKTLDLMINRKLLADYALSYDENKLTEYEINEVFKAVLDSLEEAFDEYKVTARKMLDLKAVEESSTAESEESFLKEDYRYSKRAELLPNNQIKYVAEEDVLIPANAVIDYDIIKNFYGAEKVDGKLATTKSTNEIVNIIYAEFMSRASKNNHYESDYSLIYDKAMGLFSKYLISYEYYLRDDNGDSYSTDTPSLLKRLITRLYESEMQSSYISNLEENYLKKATDLSVEKLLIKYNTLAETDHYKYQNVATYYNYLSTVGTSADLVYYIPANIDEDAEFNYFLHVLIPIEDDTFYTTVGELKDEVDEEVLMGKIEALIKEKGYTHQARNAHTGVLEDQEIGVIDILDEYKEVYDLNSFMDYMFKYTSDTATLTADMPYVIGYQGDTKYSGMVDEFTDEAIRLMKEDETMTSRYDFVVTTYGIHLLYRLSETEFGYEQVKSNIPYEDRDLICIDYNRDGVNSYMYNGKYNLYHMQVNKLTGRTYFDVLFDLVYPADTDSVYASENGYVDYEEGILSRLRDDSVKYYKTKIDNTL